LIDGNPGEGMRNKQRNAVDRGRSGEYNRGKIR
jgi:hypothetical protein